MNSTKTSEKKGSESRCQRCAGTGTHPEYTVVDGKKKWATTICVACDGEGVTKLPYTVSNPKWLVVLGVLANRHYRRTARSTYGIRLARKQTEKLNERCVAEQELEREEKVKVRYEQEVNVSDM